jgi:hypothetical protein
MKYLLLLHRGAAEDLPDPASPEAAALFDAYLAANEAMASAGVLIDCAPLESVSAATTVRVRNGETLLTDGPAAELKEQVGGYTLIECADLDEAIKWAASIPAARDASVEIRPVVNAREPGRVSTS